MSRDKLIEAVEHYQRNLDRGLKEENTTKLLHCIFKLSNMPITVAHLEHTGIGRTVNAMRKMDGEVGDAARELVNKWKLMVSQNQECEETNADESNGKGDPSSHRPDDRAKAKERHGRRESDDGRSSHSEKSESGNSSSDDDEEDSESSSDDEDDEEEEDERRRRRRESVEERRSESPARRYEKHGKDRERYEGGSKYDRYRESNDRYKGSDRAEKVSSNERRKESKDRHREDSRKHKEHTNERRKEKSRSDSDRERRRSRSPPEKDKDKERHRESNKRKRESEAEESYSKKSKGHHHREETKHKREKDRHSEEKHREKDKKESRRDDTKSKSKEKHKEQKPKSGGKVDRNENGICSESGTSFADALGMLAPSTSKGAKKPKQDKIREKSPEKQKPELSSSSSSSSKSESKDKPKKDKEHDSKKETKIEIVIPPPPKNDVDINISSLLPTITPNYRPLANPLYDNVQNSRGKTMNEDEALRLVMSQKNQRTKVFSGNKLVWGSVPTLFELCIRVLQDNIDALEYTGGVPYAILKPVLDKASPQQLYTMEHYNAYLIEDTDDVWKFHCSKEFKNKKRQELESWRDMYMRCLDEREAKLKALTENIKVSQEKSTPVRQTKLAYMDSVVKPPRDVIRKQVKNGIDRKPSVTPQSRLNAVASGSSNAQVCVPNPVRASSSSGTASVKPKKAPLMQKTLAFLKGGRFRR